MSWYLSIFLALGALSGYALCKVLLAPKFNPLRRIAGPPCKGFMGDLGRVLEYVSYSLGCIEGLNEPIFKSCVLSQGPRYLCEAVWAFDPHSWCYAGKQSSPVLPLYGLDRHSV